MSRPIGQRIIYRCKVCERERWQVPSRAAKGYGIYCSKACRALDERNGLSEFWTKVVPTMGCWIWCGNYFSNGYASFTQGGRKLLAHKFMFEHVGGSIPDGLQLDHICHNRGCVNPHHLEPVTRSENVRRGVEWRKQHAA